MRRSTTPCICVNDAPTPEAGQGGASIWCREGPDLLGDGLRGGLVIARHHNHANGGLVADIEGGQYLAARRILQAHETDPHQLPLILYASLHSYHRSCQHMPPGKQSIFTTDVLSGVGLWEALVLYASLHSHHRSGHRMPSGKQSIFTIDALSGVAVLEALILCAGLHSNHRSCQRMPPGKQSIFTFQVLSGVVLLDALILYAGLHSNHRSCQRMPPGKPLMIANMCFLA